MKKKTRAIELRDGKLKIQPGFKLFLVTLPLLIMYFLLCYLPLEGWKYSFYNYKAGYPLEKCEYVGLYHFARMFANHITRRETFRVLKNTFIFSGIGILTSFVPMFFAIFLNEIKNDKFKYIYIDSYKDYLLINDERLFYKLPRVNECYREINARVLASGIGSLYHYNNVDTDFSFNVVNSYSVAFLHSLGVNKVCLSYELNNYQIKDIIDCYHKRYKKHPNLEVIINSREEAMVTKFNLLEYYGIISGNLKDKFGNLYPIKVNDGLMYIYNYKKRIIKDFEMFDIGVNVVRIHY